MHTFTDVVHVLLHSYIYNSMEHFKLYARI